MYREVPTTTLSAIGRGEPLKQNIEGPNAISQERLQLNLGNIKCFFSGNYQKLILKFNIFHTAISCSAVILETYGLFLSSDT